MDRTDPAWVRTLMFYSFSKPLIVRMWLLFRYAGWWGHDLATRFEMPPHFNPIKGAQGFQQSNPDILSCASLLGSLQTFKRAGMIIELRPRSQDLTSALADELARSSHYIVASEVVKKYGPRATFNFDPLSREMQERDESTYDETPRFTIITPFEPAERGAQLSLFFLPPGKGIMQRVFDGIKPYGILGDERKPDVIRLAPAPLYNTEEDCTRAVRALNAVFDDLLHDAR